MNDAVRAALSAPATPTSAPAGPAAVMPDNGFYVGYALTVPRSDRRKAYPKMRFKPLKNPPS